MKKTLTKMLATGFGLGYSPVASGTVGTIPGIVIAYLLFSGVAGDIGLMVQVCIVIALTAVAVPICDRAEDLFRKKDDGRIVADEYLTFPICLLGLPWEPWVVAMAFVTCRLMDILKPPPAHGLQSLKGGFGIVVDDVVASLYSLALNHLLFWIMYAHVLPWLAAH